MKCEDKNALLDVNLNYVNEKIPYYKRHIFYHDFKASSLKIKVSIQEFLTCSSKDFHILAFYNVLFVNEFNPFCVRFNTWLQERFLSFSLGE